MIAQAWSYVAWSALLVVATGFCALYCGLETGIYVLNKIRLDLRAEGGDHRARFLRRMLAKPNRLLAVLLIGTNLSSYAVTFAVTAMFVQAGAAARAEWYALAVVTPLLFVAGDSVPKGVFQRMPERLTYRLTWLLGASDALFTITGLSPLIRGVSWLLMRPLRGRHGVADERVRAIFAEGRAAGVLTHVQSVMVDRVMQISEVTLPDVMVPMGRAATAGRDVDRAELIELARQNNHSRLPVRDAGGAVVGVLDIYDVLTDESVTCPADRMAEPFLLPETLTVTEAICRMQRAGAMMAIVHADNRPVGLITIKDLVEEIVGELEEW